MPEPKHKEYGGTLMERIASIYLNRSWWVQVLVIVLVSISYIQLSGILGTRVLAPAIGWDYGGSLPAGENADNIEGRFVRWDSGYYLIIAQRGYRAGGSESAFLPLYPLLIYLIRHVSNLPLLWGGLIVSVSCFVVGCLLLYQWVLIDYSSKIAVWSVVWICIFPMSFFFVAFYAEALFLLVSIASIFFARRGQFITSGLFIALAGVTRPPAFLLAIPYIIEFWQQNNFNRTQILKFLVGGLIASCGLIGYLIFLGIQAGSYNLDIIYFSNQATEWNRSITWPWVTLYDGANAAIFGVGINPDWFSRAIVWQDLSYAILGLILAIWALFNIRLSTSLFLIVSMLFFYTNHGPYGYAFWSLPRYIATMFPFYLVFALLTIKLPKVYRWLLSIISLSLLGILAAWFASGRWVA